MNKYRTHNCADLSEKEIGENVILSGWLHRKRDHGNLLFIDLRSSKFKLIFLSGEIEFIRT